MTRARRRACTDEDHETADVDVHQVEADHERELAKVTRSDAVVDVGAMMVESKHTAVRWRSLVSNGDAAAASMFVRARTDRRSDSASLVAVG